MTEFERVDAERKQLIQDYNNAESYEERCILEEKIKAITPYWSFLSIGKAV